MIKLCTVTAVHYCQFLSILKLSENSAFSFLGIGTNRNAELTEIKIRVIFDWKNSWKGIRVSWEIILLSMKKHNHNFPQIPRNWPGQNISKILDLKPSTVSNASDIGEITKNFDDHVSVCKIKEAYSEILREDNFSFKMVSMDEVKKEVLKLN